MPDTTVNDFTPGALEDQAGLIGVSVAQWAYRSPETGADVHQIRAANLAMDTIDRMLAELQKLRSGLVTEIREDQDQRAARVDRMLAAHESALAGTCSHGGHGWDGETCSDITAADDAL